MCVKEAVPASGRETERGDLIILMCPVTCGKREREGRSYSLELLTFLGEKESFYFVVLSLIGCLTGKKKKHTSLIVVMEETLSH